MRRNPARASRLLQGGCEPLQLRFGGALDFATRLQVGRQLRGFKPEVVVAWMNRAARHTQAGDWPLVGRLGGYYDLNYYRRCNHLIGNTRGIVAWIVQQGWPAARVRWLPNFVNDLHGAAPISRVDLGVPQNGKLVLALGRLHRNKAFDVLIRAMAALPDALLVIAGDGPERQALRELALAERVDTRVYLPGWVSDVAGLMAASDVLVCPSRHEPLGNVVLEGWSADRPVVATQVSGPAELINSGVDGVLVEPEAPRALALALSEIIERPAWAASLARAGRRRFEQEFAMAPVLAQWRAGLAEMSRG
jgi:glycosyltransferase involved in cell wall biosynthesis